MSDEPEADLRLSIVPSEDARKMSCMEAVTDRKTRPNTLLIDTSVELG